MDKKEGTHSTPTYSYVNEQAVDEELKCPVCFDPLVTPAVCQNCRNTFCRKCVESLTRCPICRGNVHPLQEPPRLLLNLLGKLLVKCNVCSKEVKRGDLSSHTLHECPINCTWGCDALLTRATLSSHKDVCPYKLIQCQASDVGCTFTAPRMSVDNHLNNCPFIVLRPLLQAQQARIQELEDKVRNLERLNLSQQPRKRLPLTIKFGTAPQPVEVQPHPNTRRRRLSFSETSESDEDEDSEAKYGEESETPRVMTRTQRRKKRHKS